MKKRINFFDKEKGKKQTAILENGKVKTKDGRIIPESQAKDLKDSPYFETKKSK